LDPALEDLIRFWNTAPPDVRERLVAAARARPAPADEDASDDDLLEDDAAAPRRPQTAAPVGRSGQLSGPLKNLLIVAAVIGVVLAVWAIGRPAATGEQTTSTATEGSGVDYAELAIELETKLEADPNNVDLMLELGMAYFYSGELEQAATQWRAVSELNPESAGAWYYLGFYYLSTEPRDVAAAKAAWEKVLELAPGSEWAEFVTNHIDTLDESSGSASAGASGAASADAAAESSSGPSAGTAARAASGASAEPSAGASASALAGAGSAAGSFGGEAAEQSAGASAGGP
jgi:tetratricopeptide (TPR) repeat protein